MVRMSLGVYNTFDDVDALVAMLQRIARNDYHGQYEQVPESGDYMPAGYEDTISSHLSLVGGGRASGRRHADERADDARKKGPMEQDRQRREHPSTPSRPIQPVSGCPARDKARSASTSPLVHQEIEERRPKSVRRHGHAHRQSSRQ